MGFIPKVIFVGEVHHWVVHCLVLLAGIDSTQHGLCFFVSGIKELIKFDCRQDWSIRIQQLRGNSGEQIVRYG